MWHKIENSIKIYLQLIENMENLERNIEFVSNSKQTLTQHQKWMPQVGTLLKKKGTCGAKLRIQLKSFCS